MCSLMFAAWTKMESSSVCFLLQLYTPAWLRQTWGVPTGAASTVDSRAVTCPKAKGQQMVCWFPAESDKPTFAGKAKPFL